MALRLLLLALALGGCAAADQQSSCYTVDCLMQETEREVADQCRSDLFWYANRSRAEQQTIDETYRYPFTDMETFSMLQRAGLKGVSPGKWCRRYAEVAVQSARQVDR